jgi:hypothetical protein
MEMSTIRGMHGASALHATGLSLNQVLAPWQLAHDTSLGLWLHTRIPAVTMAAGNLDKQARARVT